MAPPAVPRQETAFAFATDIWSPTRCIFLFGVGLISPRRARCLRGARRRGWDVGHTPESGGGTGHPSRLAVRPGVKPRKRASWRSTARSKVRSTSKKETGKRQKLARFGLFQLAWAITQFGTFWQNPFSTLSAQVGGGSADAERSKSLSHLPQWSRRVGSHHGEDRA